jgi:hypothetical protein
MSARNSNLTRAKILVVEDDAIIALEIAATLMDVATLYSARLPRWLRLWPYSTPTSLTRRCLI